MVEKYISRLSQIDKLIKRKATGTPSELSDKLGVSESTVFRLLRIMRENMSLSIEWNSEYNSYVYCGNENFNLERFLLSAQE
jgi:ribosomal protein S25